MIRVKPEKAAPKRKRTVGQPGGVLSRSARETKPMAGATTFSEAKARPDAAASKVGAKDIPIHVVTELQQREPGAGKNRRPAPPVLEVVAGTGDGLDRVTFSAPKAERWPERLEAARAVRGLRSTSEVIRELLAKALREVTP